MKINLTLKAENDGELLVLERFHKNAGFIIDHINVMKEAYSTSLKNGAVKIDATLNDEDINDRLCDIHVLISFLGDGLSHSIDEPAMQSFRDRLTENSEEEDDSLSGKFFFQSDGEFPIFPSGREICVSFALERYPYDDRNKVFKEFCEYVHLFWKTHMAAKSGSASNPTQTHHLRDALTRTDEDYELKEKSTSENGVHEAIEKARAEDVRLTNFLDNADKLFGGKYGDKGIFIPGCLTTDDKESFKKKSKKCCKKHKHGKKSKKCKCQKSRDTLCKTLKKIKKAIDHNGDFIGGSLCAVEQSIAELEETLSIRLDNLDGIMDELDELNEIMEDLLLQISKKKKASHEKKDKKNPDSSEEFKHRYVKRGSETAKNLINTLDDTPTVDLRKNKKSSK